MPRRYNINPLKKDFDLTETQSGGTGSASWGNITGNLSNQTDLQTALDSKVNDTGDTMTGDLSFTNAGINNANQITFNTSATETITEGVLTYNQNTGNLELGLAGGNVSVALGKGLMLPRRCKNQSGTTMTKGTVVYISGVSGNNPIISRAVNTSDSTSAYTIGLTAEDITDGHEGWVVFQGELAGIDLSTYTAGDTLYLSATPGEFTKVIQKAPNHYVRIGIVTKATASGEMIVNIINGYELDEIHNVQINSVATGEILQYQTDGLWKNVTLSGVITQHNNLSGIQGGTTNEYYHLTNLERSTVQATSGTNTGDVSIIDTRTIDLTVSGQVLQASVIPNNITHNSLGELQGGTTGQFNHITNLELQTLQATSGTNTGDITVQDTRTIDLTLSGQLLQASIIPSAITHNSLSEIQGGATNDYQHLTTAQVNNLNSLVIVSGSFLKLDLSNVPLTGNTLSFDNTATKTISVNRTTTASTPGRSLNITSGGAVSGGTNQAGGNLQLSGGISTGNNGSDITFLTATPGTSGTTDRNPTEKVRIKGSGNVGIGTTAPAYKLDIAGTIRSTGDASFEGNIISTSVTNGYFGDGTDGSVSFDAFNRYPEFETFDSATSTYTLTRDIYASGVTVGSGVTVKTSGYRIFCNGILSNNGGYISNDGTNASGTTAGTGGAGGFFKAGTNGVAGLGTASAGAVGTAPSTVTNLVGGIGGRGGAGYATQTTFKGTSITSANAGKPTNATGSSKLVSNLANYFISFIPSGTATNFQFTPSSGGGSGAKSATGTTATSGAGGGGGGVVFIASKTIINTGTISAYGGNGSDATAGVGNTANIGAGGGGGGGIVAIVTSNFQTQTLGFITANGGSGGYGIEGTNATRAVAVAGSGTTGTTSGFITFTPTEVLNKTSIYMVSVILVGTSCTVQSLYIPNFTLTEVASIDFSTIASPGRRLALYMATWDNNPTELTQIDNQIVELEIAGTPTSCRFIIDEIQNGDIFASPLYTGFATNSSDSTTNLTTDLGYVPTSGNMVYSVFARVGGTTPVVGTGNTVISNYNTAPFLYTEVSLNRQTNNHTWTTATACAGISVDLPQPANTWYNASNGWNGKVIYFKV